ncbi:MAG: hypothetical protein ACPF9D_03450, partial [Owenweeksia sp.]
MNNTIFRYGILIMLFWGAGARAQTSQAYADSVKRLVASEGHYILSDSTDFTFELLLNDPEPLKLGWASSIGLGLGYTERQLLLGAYFSGYIEPVNRVRIYFDASAVPGFILAKPIISDPQARGNTNLSGSLALTLFKQSQSRYAAMLISSRETRINGKHVVHFEDFKRVTN